MATFKVGQRVKRIAFRPSKDGVLQGIVVPLGAEGTIIAQVVWPGCDCVVLYDNYRSSHQCGGFSANTYELAPLTDPNAEWASSAVKKLVERCKTQPMEIVL